MGAEERLTPKFLDRLFDDNGSVFHFYLLGGLIEDGVDIFPYRVDFLFLDIVWLLKSTLRVYKPFVILVGMERSLLMCHLDHLLVLFDFLFVSLPSYMGNAR